MAPEARNTVVTHTVEIVLLQQDALVAVGTVYVQIFTKTRDDSTNLGMPFLTGQCVT